MKRRKNRYLGGKPISPAAITAGVSAADLIDDAFLAYNAGRLRDGCRLFVERMLEEDVTIGITLTGALTPAGLGMSALIPLIEAGFVDWIISTGANLYHDTHFGLGMEMRQGNPFVRIPMNFRYFFVRKTMFVKYAEGFVIFPGGFGTMDELFEALTLVQTGKVRNFPLILFGSDYWSGLYDWLRGTMAKRGNISPDDLRFLSVTDSPEEAVRIVYECYERNCAELAAK